MEPVISDVVADLNVDSDGSLSLTITNLTTVQSIMDGVLDAQSVLVGTMEAGRTSQARHPVWIPWVLMPIP